MNLLIVDDEVYVVRVMQKKVDWKSAEIEQVHSAFSVDKAKEIMLSYNIDVLLTDIEMPGESGLSLLKWVRDQGMDVKAICLTSHAEFQYAKEAISLDVMDYVLKPVDFAQLQELVHKAVRELEIERKTKQDSTKGTLWDYNKESIESQFWRSFIVQPGGKSLQSEINEAERKQIDFNVDEEYVLLLFAIRRIYDKQEDWKNNRKIMDFIIANMCDEVFEKDENGRSGWENDYYWTVLDAKETDSLDDKIQGIVEICRKITGASLVVYSSCKCYAEELPIKYKELVQQDENNVSIEQGFYENDEISRETVNADRIFQDVKKAASEPGNNSVEEKLRNYCMGRVLQSKRELQLYRKAVEFEIERDLDCRRVSLDQFWSEQLLEDE